MLYLEQVPQPALAPFVKTLWYCRYPDAPHRREIVLPTGRMQIVISLAHDYLTDCTNDLAAPPSRSPAALLLGVQSRYQVVDSIDFAGIIGVVFRAGGITPFFDNCAHLFTNAGTSLGDIWGNSTRDLRDRLREVPTPDAKLALLQSSLLERLYRARKIERNPVVDFALRHLQVSPGTATVAGLTREIGLSPRRLSQLFREYVGVSPKLYCRIERFQQAVQRLHRGEDLPWAELALDCGYYDQSHFANDFRTFSGISPTTYSASKGPWVNHVALD